MTKKKKRDQNKLTNPVLGPEMRKQKSPPLHLQHMAEQLSETTVWWWLWDNSFSVWSSNKTAPGGTRRNTDPLVLEIT